MKSKKILFNKENTRLKNKNLEELSRRFDMKLASLNAPDTAGKINSLFGTVVDDAGFPSKINNENIEKKIKSGELGQDAVLFFSRETMDKMIADFTKCGDDF